jgi:uncharacterized protein (TIGR02246 family)
MSQLLPRAGFVLLAITLFSARLLSAQDAPAADTSADEEAVRQAAIRFVEAYNAHDAKAVSELFGPKARMEDQDGELIEGREAIEQSYADEFEDSPKASISLAVDSLTFITPDVAVEEGAVEVYPDGETLTARSRYVAVHLKKDNLWRIISSRSIDRDVVSNYDQLRDLEWLTGEWIDEGEDSVVEFNSRWDDNKAYLLNDFQVIQDGAITTRGTQRIGWDPQSKTIRAWIFDSNGGFGEAQWTPGDGVWIAKASGVSADGTTASATRIYTPVDHDHIIVSTRDRIVDGEVQSDSELTLVRKAPAPQTAAAQ